MVKEMVIVENVYKSYPKYKRFHPGTVLGRAHWFFATLYRSKKEGVVEALKGVSFTVRKGEVFAIIGPNGAGKTTLVKCIGAVLLPDRGHIEVDGIDVVKEPLKAKRRINIIGTSYWAGFDWSLTLEENLELYAVLYGYSPKEAREQIKDVLDILGLRDKAKDNPTKLSSGERQRLSLARGFIVNVPVYLIDEPTIGLDPVGAEEVRNYIKEGLKKRGVTIIFTTHFMHEAEQIADRIAILKDGKIMALGSPEDLKMKFNVGKLVELKAYNVYEDVIKRIKDLEIIDLDVFYRNYGAEAIIKILTKKPEETLDNVVDILINSRSTILSVNIRDPSLEDTYRVIIGGRVE